MIMQVSGGFFFMERPIFDVDVELKVPNVSMNPALEEIQSAINSCAKTILITSKSLPCWGQTEASTFYEFIVQDKEIVKSILRMTGSVDGIKNQVRVYCGVAHVLEAQLANASHTCPTDPPLAVFILPP